ncbi:aldo/keto reductase [Methanothermobacter sp. THM-2]|uniref:aldo/keto reductase n=1 Tax=Methanothermobacter sp. THM-2 TaxID=2606912 RepID=UPI0013655453|nr:aldo/keto reductase [Methanothermobacter sp. THM-2]QHN07327.1 aldo/keto reductase [Methanothermobacter sp. THM-2]
MIRRKLGSTDISVSILGIGVMRFPEVNGRLERGSAAKIMEFALESGINYIDTGYTYHGGESEVFVGEFLSENSDYRDDAVVATKLPTWLVNRREDMDVYFEEQMNRLRGKIDIYLLHNLKKDSWLALDDMGVLDFLDSLRDDGIYVGFSFHDTADVFFDIADSYSWDVIQVQHNIVDDHQANPATLAYARETGAGTVIMEPLRGGSLVHNIPPEVQEIYEMASSPRKPVEWCLRYLWDMDDVDVVLSGMSSISEVRENIEIALNAEKLTEDDYEILREVKRAYRMRKSVPCSGCGYCMPCPEGVDIPHNFRLMNDVCRFLSTRGVETEYWKIMDARERASNCSGCGSCMPCPQMIDIPSELRRVHENLEGGRFD